jgi:hypothetical protein
VVNQLKEVSMYCVILALMRRLSRFIPGIGIVLILSGSAVASDRLFPLDLSTVPAETRSKLPLPYGISVNYIYVTEKLDVDNLNLIVNGQSIPSSLVDLKSLEQHTNVETVRVDLWVLSFLDLYGIGGLVNGDAKKLDFSIDQAQVAALPPSLQALLPLSLLAPGFSVDYRGNVFGGGATLGGEYGPFLFSYDANYTWTTVDQLDTRVKSIVQGVRVRYRIEAFHSRFSIYTGASNEDIKARQKGSINLGGAHIEYSLRATAANPWNALAGGQVEFTPHWNLTVEGGFIGRKQFLSSLAYRF